MKTLNFNGFSNLQDNPTVQELQKAAQEGVYADTPTNRQKGRVGMSYKIEKKNSQQEYKQGDIVYFEGKKAKITALTKEGKVEIQEIIDGQKWSGAIAEVNAEDLSKSPNKEKDPIKEGGERRGKENDENWDNKEKQGKIRLQIDAFKPGKSELKVAKDVELGYEGRGYKVKKGDELVFDKKHKESGYLEFYDKGDAKKTIVARTKKDGLVNFISNGDISIK